VGNNNNKRGKHLRLVTFAPVFVGKSLIHYNLFASQQCDTLQANQVGKLLFI
jgi:hypothetical protein